MTKTSNPGAYETRVAHEQGLGLNSLRMHEFSRGEVIHRATGEVAWKSKPYGDDRGARLQANRAKAGFEHHLARTGQRWEVEQRDAKAARLAERKAIDVARAETRAHAGDLLTMVIDLIAAVDDPKTLAFTVNRAKALVAPLSFPAVPK
jgi:hypothetical protein